MECAVDSDCPSTLVCFANTSWFSPLGEATEMPAGVPYGCGYSSWYGWDGNPMDTQGIATPVTRWWLGSSMTLVVIAMLAFALNCEVMVTLAWRLRKRGDPKIITSIQLLVGALAMAGMQSAMFARIFFPEHADEPDAASTSTEKASTDDKVAYVFLGIALAATLQALVSVGVVWIIMANATARLRSSDDDMRRIQRFSLGFEIFIALAFIVVLAVKYYSLLAIPVAIVAIVVFVTYSVGLYKMRVLLLEAASIAGGSRGPVMGGGDVGGSTDAVPGDKSSAPGVEPTSGNAKVHSNMRMTKGGGEEGGVSSGEGGDTYRRKQFLSVLRNIYNYTILVMIASMALIISFIINMVLSVAISWKETCRTINSPCYVIVNWQFISFFVLVLNLTITSYIRGAVKKMVLAQQRTEAGREDSRNNQRTLTTNDENQKGVLNRAYSGGLANTTSSPSHLFNSFAGGGKRAESTPSSSAIVNREDSQTGA